MEHNLSFRKALANTANTVNLPKPENPDLEHYLHVARS